MAKRVPRWKQAPLQQELSGSMFDHVEFDVIDPLPITANGNRYHLNDDWLILEVGRGLCPS